MYVTLQKHAQEVADRLCSYGLDATVYHAGLPAADRERVQLAFMRSEKGIVCATIAFGMGIDKGAIQSSSIFQTQGNTFFQPISDR